MENLHYYLIGALIIICLGSLYVKKGLKKTAIIAVEAIVIGFIAAFAIHLANTYL